MTEQASRETTAKDVEGAHFVCEAPSFDREGRQFGCGYEGYLIPNDWDTRDWARATCPQCFEPIWTRVYA